MLCALLPRPFDRMNWIYEIKWDGFRAIAEIDRAGVRLHSRKRKSLNGYFPELLDSLAKLDHEAVLDGEVVVLDEQGRSHFERLRHRKRGQKGQLLYYVFDLLYLDGHDLRRLPLIRRKAILKALMERCSLPGVQYSDHLEEEGRAFFEVAVERGLEGIVGKDGASPYVSGQRTNYWVKFKNYRVQEFQIGGFTGSRTHIETLLFGLFRDGDFIYVGNTDKGLPKSNQAADLRSELAKLLRNTSPFKNQSNISGRIHWVEPKLGCRVRFLEWTQDERLRHAVFLGLNRGHHDTLARLDTVYYLITRP
jgi:bifunctional non-homologous end joining protein LigD